MGSLSEDAQMLKRPEAVGCANQQARPVAAFEGATTDVFISPEWPTYLRSKAKI
jgi:hypothetical protein